MNAHVQRALEEIKACFKPKEFVVDPDGAGGARVHFGPVDLSASYLQRETWLGGHLPAQLPYADVYPIFMRGDLARADRAQLVPPITAGHNFMGLPAVQVSRRTNGSLSGFGTPAMKFMKVLNWVNSQ